MTHSELAAAGRQAMSDPSLAALIRLIAESRFGRAVIVAITLAWGVAIFALVTRAIA